MPVHDLGYREWGGRRMPRILRPLVVARSGISLVWRRRWLKMMLMLGWLPIVVPAILIFAFEYSATSPDLRVMISGFLRSPMINRPDLAAETLVDPAAARHQVWSMVTFVFFRYPQLYAMVMLIGLIAPMLVSYDLRSKAYLMYFSRPLSAWEYIVGKSAVVWFFLAMIVTIPAFALYVLGVLLSPDLSVISETWDILPRIICASIVLLVPTTALAVCYSSFTSESRYATFGWFATWVVGYVSYYMLTYAPLMFQNAPGPRRPRPRRGEPPQPIDWEQDFGLNLDRWRWLSPYHTLEKVQEWVFGVEVTSGSAIPSMLVLMVTTGVCLWLVRHRILARLSV